MLIYLLKAWMIGLAVSVPVGPIGMLCIRKTLELGFIGAIAVGLGAALADSVYGLIAATGLNLVSEFLLAKIAWIKILGGVFLLYLAYTEIKSSWADSSKTLIPTDEVFKLVYKVFFLTLTNPMTILIFIGIFAGIGGATVSMLELLVMVAGVFLGSMTWWFILGFIIVKIKHKLPELWLDRIRYFSSFIFASFGVFAILVGITSI